MRFYLVGPALLSLAGFLVACGSSSSSPPPPVDSGPPMEAAPPPEGGGPEAGPPDAGGDAGPVPVPPSASNIKHLVVIVQENHSFDSYFGSYCTAAAGSNPTCNSGPSCCEAAPATDPGSSDSPVVLDDTENGAFDPNHLQACELDEIDTGKMDKYVTSAMCGNPKNFAIANSATAMPYWTLAQQNALADRYFQPVAGATSSNDMYLARAKFVFLDNALVPASIGSACSFSTKMTYTDQTIADLLIAQNVPWGWYAGGYQAMIDAQAKNMCPMPPADCPAQTQFYPCNYDPSDVPFEYYKSLQDNPKYMFDGDKFPTDVASMQMPAVTFVKAIGYRTEHPGGGDLVSAGVTFVTGVINAVQQSAFASDTLILLTYDESGGFFDHIAPPPTSAVDMQPYGPRVPMLAIGPFARKNFVSHVVMEHSSIVKFIEWNWLGKQTGQLGTRDAVVNNIGSLLDPAMTGTAVPEQ